MNRGICLCYPLIRGKAVLIIISFIGTRYFDDNWLLSGIAERKLTHVMDFIDAGIYLKEKGLA